MLTAGVLGIGSWQDLLKKCSIDLERMRMNPRDAYAAYDFFVTARHVPEWMYPGDSGKQSNLFDAHVEMRICRHIADGAKHLLLTNPKLKQVRSSYSTDNIFGNLFGNLFGNMFGVPALIIELDLADADTQQIGAKITAINLAEKVLKVLSNVAP